MHTYVYLVAQYAGIYSLESTILVLTECLLHVTFCMQQSKFTMQYCQFCRYFLLDSLLLIY